MSMCSSCRHPFVGFHVSVRGMPVWRNYSARSAIDALLRIVRAIMLKGSTLQNLQYDTIALVA